MSDYRDQIRVALDAAALVLADHLFHPRSRPGEAPVFAGSCTCKEWYGMDFDHPAHLADVLAQAGLLRDAPVTPRTFQDAPD